MNGFERLESMVKDQKDEALKQTVKYLISRKDLEPKFLNEEKTLDGMAKFIRDKGLNHYHNGWNYVTNELVYAWAVMYFTLPNEFLKIEKSTNSNTENKIKTSSTSTKNNVISIEKAKEKVEQISLFGGGENDEN